LVEWVVVRPQTPQHEVMTSFRVFAPDVSAKQIHEEMSKYNRGSLVNDAARIAMFFPGTRCTTQVKDCGVEGSREVREKLVALFKAYVPTAEHSMP
jgi:hypothetical protein